MPFNTLEQEAIVKRNQYMILETKISQILILYCYKVKNNDSFSDRKSILKFGISRF